MVHVDIAIWTVLDHPHACDGQPTYMACHDDMDTMIESNARKRVYDVAIET
jgi:hypothetical protein